MGIAWARRHLLCSVKSLTAVVCMHSEVDVHDALQCVHRTAHPGFCTEKHRFRLDAFTQGFFDKRRRPQLESEPAHDCECFVSLALFLRKIDILPELEPFSALNAYARKPAQAPKARAATPRYVNRWSCRPQCQPEERERAHRTYLDRRQ